jgi:hypothetical protein
MDEQGLSYTFKKKIDHQGKLTYDIVKELSIPPEKIEAVFRNGKVINIYDTVMPGDRVAFFPHGTPGPYRVFLGMAKENLKRSRLEKNRTHKEDQW